MYLTKFFLEVELEKHIIFQKFSSQEKVDSLLWNVVLKIMDVLGILIFDSNENTFLY